MRTVRLSALFLLCTCLILLNGCNSEIDNLKIQNSTQQKRIAGLESELQTAKVRLEQLQRQLDTAEGRSAGHAQFRRPGDESDVVELRILARLDRKSVV